MPDVEAIIAASRATRERIARQRATRGGTRSSMDGSLEARAQALVRRIERSAEAAEYDNRMARVRAARPSFFLEERRFDAQESRERRRAMAHFVRTGEIRASLRTANDTGGGVFVPIEFSQLLTQNLVQVSAVRSVALVSGASSDTVRVPRRSAASTASWVGETDTAPATAPAYGGLDVTINDARCYVDISNNLLRDAAVDIEAWLMDELATEMARLEGAAFINGTGPKQPQGILQSSEVKSYTSSTTNTIIADDIIALPFQLPAFYAKSGVWMMNRTTMGAIRGFKDNYGRYIFDSNLDKDGLPTIQGAKVVDCPDMPNIATGNAPIVYGDMSKGYVIFDREGMPMIRDIVTQAVNNTTRFHYFARTGGAVRLGEALVKLVVK